MGGVGLDLVFFGLGCGFGGEAYYFFLGFFVVS